MVWTNVLVQGLVMSFFTRWLTAFLLVAALAACKQPLERVPLEQPAFDAGTLTHLKQTRPDNMASLLADKGLADKGLSDKGLGGGNTSLKTVNPYMPAMPMTLEACQQDLNCSYALARFWMPTPTFPAQSMVYDWWVNRALAPEQAAVCGVRFNDESKIGYSLKTFANLDALQAESGYQLTHYHACGACSTLQDLAIYGELDLTRMAKTCSKRTTFADKLACMEAIGFTQACAESWAYNAVKTGQSCALICVAEYGLVPLLTGTENKPPVDDNGELNACLMCDERMAGPGFQFAAGRTRRNSGIVSEIDRPDEQIYSVPHHYFDD